MNQRNLKKNLSDEELLEETQQKEIMDINIEKIPKLQELITDQQDSIKQLEEKCTENKKKE